MQENLKAEYCSNFTGKVMTSTGRCYRKEDNLFVEVSWEDYGYYHVTKTDFIIIDNLVEIFADDAIKGICYRDTGSDLDVIATGRRANSVDKSWTEVQWEENGAKQEKWCKNRFLSKIITVEVMVSCKLLKTKFVDSLDLQKIEMCKPT